MANETIRRDPATGEMLPNDVPVEAPPTSIPDESSADASLLRVGLFAGLRSRWRAAAKPRYHNPTIAAALNIVPGVGYFYLWRWGSGLLTMLLFLLAYVALGYRFLEFTPDELQKRATPINPLPEFDLWRLDLATPATLLLFGGLMLLLWLNIAGRAHRQAILDNLAFQGADKAELRRARGTWRDALLYFNWLGAVVTVFGIALLVKDTEFDLKKLADKFSNLANYIGGLLQPALSELWIPKGIMYAMRVTLEISIVGTLIGALFALVLSLLAARNLMGRNPITNVAYYVVRVILSVVRAVPTLFLALIFVVSVGAGAFPAVLALSIFSAGLMTKLFSEAIEAIDWGQVEAVQAAGGSPIHVVIFAVVPQVVPYYISGMLYCWEVNVHSSAILGYVGAGGIGLYVKDAIESYQYAKGGAALLVVIIVTVTIDFTSAYVRSRIV